MVDPRVLQAIELTVSPHQTDVQKGATELAQLLETAQVDTIQTLCEVLTNSQNGHVQLGAALYLKNVIKRRWDMESGLAPEVRIMMRKAIVTILCSVPQNIRAILMDVLEVMVAADFPMDWDTLLPTIIAENYVPFLQANATNPDCDLTKIKIIVDILHGALLKYEEAFNEPQVLRELKLILNQAQEPILHMLQWSSNCYKQVSGQSFKSLEGSENIHAAAGGQSQRALLLSQMATKSILAVKALHGVDLPEYYEDNLPGLMQICCQALSLPPCKPADDLAAASANYIEGRPLPSEEMKIAACDLIHVYVTRFGEEIMPFIVECSKSLLITLQQSTLESSQDTLVASVMTCLAAVAKVCWGPEVNPFRHIPEMLGFLCREAIVKNILLRPDDVEDAADEPLQFFRDDIEGLQRGARREGASTLVKSLMVNHEKDVCDFLLETSKLMLSMNQSEPAARRLLAKEAAIFLITAISVKSSTRAKGVTETSQQVPLQDFLRLEILPALTSQDSDTSTEMQLVKGAALKFVCNFRRFLSTEEIQHLVPLISQHIASPSVFVSTHAAVTLERFLTLKNPNEPFLNFQDSRNVRCLSAAVSPLMVQMRSSDNEYVIRCLWRVLALVPGDVAVQAGQLKGLVSLLQAVALKPVNPSFCHYLFEAVAALSRIVAVGVGVTDQAVEVHRFVLNAMTAIITHEEGHSFVPYAYQIVAVMLGTLPAEPPVQAAEWNKLYIGVFEGVLKEDRWKVSISNIPGILQLLNVFLERAWVCGDRLVANARQLLTLFNFCLTARRLPIRLVFEFVNHIVVWMPMELLKTFATPLTQCLLGYLNRAMQRQEKLAVQSTVIAMGGLLIRCCQLLNNGSTEWPAGTSKPPAELDIPRLIEASPIKLQAYFERIVIPILSEVKFAHDKFVLAAMARSVVTHPTVVEVVSPAVIEELKKQVLLCTGLITDEAKEIQRTHKKEGITVESARQKLLEAVATEDDRGFADLSATYNRLATVPDTSLKDTILVTIVS